MPIETFTRQTRADDAATHASLLRGLSTIPDVTVTDGGNPVKFQRKRNMLKNRWAMSGSVEVRRGVVTLTIDGQGSMHQKFAEEILAHLPADMTNDHGLTAAVERMTKSERFFSSLELNHLINEFRPDEQVRLMAACAIDDKVGLIVATDKRILLKDRGAFSSRTKEIYPRQVTSISTKKAFGNEVLELTASGARIVIRNLQAGRADAIANLIRDGQNAPTAPPTAPASSSADELAKLAQLHAAGALTDDEFSSAKARILGL
ncbi:PH domain-containing protein [Enemella evansiae]|uniref:PH domain-containing protein n=1 Tax=Enemella evansiae TaxID=2016499 RepID=UPI001E443715|nr:PH domain-containing protein [Enemella evansiae]